MFDRNSIFFGADEAVGTGETVAELASLLPRITADSSCSLLRLGRLLCEDTAAGVGSVRLLCEDTATGVGSILS